MPKTKTGPLIPTSKQALARWAETNNITPAEFSRVMGYSYNHAYQLLRGEAEVTIETVGRLLMFYGPEMAQPVAKALKAEMNHVSSRESEPE